MSSDLFEQHGIDPERIPRHVAVIMDGNGRWAKKRFMNRVNGHQQGVETVRTIVTAARQIGIDVLTLYAFSTENWSRPASEVKALMVLLKRFLAKEIDTLDRQGVCLNVIGQQSRLPDDVQTQIERSMVQTRGNTGMVLNLALSYGGREEITRAVRAIVNEVSSGGLSVQDITEETVAERLYTAGQPDPDVLIRTSGEMRLSNFMLWQVAYAELFITDTLWPDFSQKEFLDIIRQYQTRERRYGKVPCISNDGSQQ
ncbi:UppS [Desulforapulum autotrophicum HRM2]|uniref:Isoprenyl transferase n=1 Tax=Desulforapulum autotrophicum (strain ATCC 43914 / DSM 3382 / VKM B-1955 / HRM2) TaxID=177437 RepID=C0QB21_DESAH|nr:UppS [Desulforapulum autotrophicum HRM2]